MKLKSIKEISTILFSIFSLNCYAQDYFVTGQNGIRHSILGKAKGENILYISEIDGSIGQYTIDGKKLWHQKTQSPAICFETLAHDIDGDNNDDVLLATGSGIYAYSSTGKFLWKYNPDEIVRFSEVATVGEGKNTKIFAGGNNFKLYELDVKGQEISQTPIIGCVRKLESGYFYSKDKKDLFLFTLKHDKFTSEFLGFIDSDTKKTIKSSTIKKISPKSSMVTDIEVADITKNGFDDLLFFANREGATAFAFDSNLKTIFDIKPKTKGKLNAKQRYAHTIGTTLLPIKDEIVMQDGGFIYRLDLKGNALSMTGTRYKEVIFNDFVFDSSSKKLFGAGQVGGDNTMYEYDISTDNWYETKHTFQGREKEVNDNIQKLYEQILAFKMPDYQTKKNKPFFVTGIQKQENLDKQIQHLNGGEIIFAESVGMPEDYDRSFLVEKYGKYAESRDHRVKYIHKHKDIVNWAKDREKNNQPFVMSAGHGGDPFFYSDETIVEIIKAAPTTCRGFIYAEMADHTNPIYEHFVRVSVPKFAEAIRKNKAVTKLFFRYKNMFWAADSYVGIWKELFYSRKFADILMPSAEDTNNRLQEVNFAGRVGMFLSGSVDNFSMRLVDDNPTSWRPLSPGGQRTNSLYIRNGAIMLAYGASAGILFPIGYLDDPKYYPMFALVKSGVLPILDKEDILSVGSYMIVKDVDTKYLADISNGHNLCTYSTDDDNAIIAKASVNWCGAQVPELDYSKFMGVDYRWLNFIPEMPYGMITPVPEFMEDQLKKSGKSYFTTNLKAGYINGKKVPAKEFGKYMQKAIQEGAQKLPLRVEGASWSLIRISDDISRLVLVDQGYIDPQERTAKIKFQTKQPKSAKDILSNEQIDVSKSEIEIKVPAGSMRFIDIKY